MICEIALLLSNKLVIIFSVASSLYIFIWQFVEQNIPFTVLRRIATYADLTWLVVFSSGTKLDINMLIYYVRVSYKTRNQPKPAKTTQNYPQQPKPLKTNKRHPLSKLNLNKNHK